MKKYLLILFILLVALVLLFGLEAVSGHARTTADEIKAEIEERIPTSHDINYARQELHDRVAGLADKHVELAELEARAEEATRKAEECETDVAEDKRELALEDELLADPRPAYEIGGRTYTYQQVRADAKRRLMLLKKHQLQAASYRETAADLLAAAQEGREALEAAEGSYQDRFAELELLESSIANGEMVREARNLAGSFDFDREVDSELAHVFERLRRTERQVWARAGDPFGRDYEKDLLIDFSGDSEEDDTDLREEIAAALRADRSDRTLSDYTFDLGDK